MLASQIQPAAQIAFVNIAFITAKFVIRLRVVGRKVHKARDESEPLGNECVQWS
jgi:hypothetical protein